MKKKSVFNGLLARYYLKKLCLMMRLMTFMVLVSVFVANANTASSQSGKLNLTFEKASMTEVFEQLEKELNIGFLLPASVMNDNRKISLSFKDASVESILEQVLDSKNYSYEFVGKNIVITQLRSVQQNIKLTGKVTDTSGQPLPGVTVVVKGTTNGTITNFDGVYSLADVPSDATIQFTFVGMRMQEISVAGKTSIDIVMEEDAIGIEEVVAVGYGTMKKSDLTGAVVSANIEAFREAPNVNILQSLQGSAPGLQIGQINQAGEAPSISVRGQTTLSGNKSVLIVLDGIVFRGSITDLNPNDIQSVDILKDASSQAIYGAQAANGVILITSKKGKVSQKPTISYSLHAFTQTPAKKARLLNREEYLQKVKDVDYQNAYLAPDYIELNPSWDYNQSALRGVILDGITNGTDYDWWDAGTSPGHVIDHNLNISGGTENTSYFISGSFTNEKGQIMNDNFKRSSVRVNFDTKIAQWLSVGANIFGAFRNYSGASYLSSPGYALGLISPLIEPKDENGNYIVNPMQDPEKNPFLSVESDDRDLRNNISGNFYAEISIPKIKGLSYRVNFNNNLMWSYHAYSNKYDFGQAGQAYKQNSSTYYMLLDNIVTYERQLNPDHKIQATLVAGFNTVENEYTNANGTNFSDLDLSFNSLQQATIQKISSSAWEESSIYQMARINYNFKDKYLLTTTLRRDGFSGFAKNNKFGLFPSIGLGWVLTNEPFLKLPNIEYLKLRVSYGQNGNQTSRYSSLAKVASGQDYVFGDGGSTAIGQQPTTLANNDLRWEATTGLNLGIDFGFLNNRIRGNIEFYKTSTTDLLWDVSLPKITGFSSIKTNLGRLDNTGLEFAVNTTPIKAGHFKWDLDVNFSTNKNEIKELLGVDNNGDGRDDDLVASGLFIGKSTGAIYSYEIDGIWQLDDDVMTGYSPGTYKIADQNDDGKITAADDRIIIGKKEPAYRFGIRNSFEYKNFTFWFFINSVQGGKNGYLGMQKPPTFSTGDTQNKNWFNLFDVNDYWSPRNPDAYYARPWVTAAIKPDRYQSRNFVRLQDISLSYKLSSSLTNRMGIGNVKIYISGKNLLTLTKWDGWDPETGQSIYTTDNYPVMRSFSLGLDLSF